MTTAAPISDDAALRPEHSPATRRRFYWIGLAIVWLFAASFLQFAWLQSYSPPAAERVNNGDHATFFAIHTNPYYIFSEDFHLYVVRSKRIMERGWTDSPLCHEPNEGTRTTAPFQAGLMVLAAKTGGGPLAYSIFMVGVLLTSWTILYTAAARWSPVNVSPFSIPLIVLVTLLFEAILDLKHLTTPFEQWPTHRALRMSTFAWSNPLALAMLLALVSLLFRRDVIRQRILFFLAGLCLLATGDLWAFMLATTAAGVVLCILASQWVRTRTSAIEARQIVTAFLGISASLVAAWGLYKLTSQGFTGDVLMRTGIGPEWRGKPLSADTLSLVRRETLSALAIIGQLVVVAGLAIRFRAATFLMNQWSSC